MKTHKIDTQSPRFIDGMRRFNFWLFLVLMVLYLIDWIHSIVVGEHDFLLLLVSLYSGVISMCFAALRREAKNKRTPIKKKVIILMKGEENDK